jgi:hypothetical protein
MPAIAAKATPCGSTIAAPVSPAMASARMLLRVMPLPQRRNGRKRLSWYWRFIA